MAVSVKTVKVDNYILAYFITKVIYVFSVKFGLIAIGLRSYKKTENFAKLYDFKVNFMVYE